VGIRPRLTHASPVGAMSPLTMSIGRYPGSVWTMMVWTAVGGANLLFALLLPANNKHPSVATMAVLSYVLVATATLLILGHRTPRWLLGVMLVMSIACTSWLIDDSVTPLGSVVSSWSYAIIAMYAALWTTLRTALAVVVAMTVSFLAVLVVKGELPLLIVAWIVSMSICLAITLLLNYLMQYMRRQATIDSLTGLLNRTGLEVLGNLGSGSVRAVRPLSLVVIDLDDFKTINDVQGHTAGDDVLRSFGMALRKNLRPDDIAVRIGGDEFMLILPRTSTQAAEETVERLRTLMPVQWSRGVADWPAGSDIDVVLAQADERMYDDKRSRRVS